LKGFGSVPQGLLDVFHGQVGISSRISAFVIPPATIPTTVATGMRRPRMRGTLSIWWGSTVIRVNVMRTSRIERCGANSLEPTKIISHSPTNCHFSLPSAEPPLPLKTLDWQARLCYTQSGPGPVGVPLRSVHAGIIQQVATHLGSGSPTANNLASITVQHPEPRPELVEG
jgi:hypothetical protein